jgi:hypothetical protein
MHNNLTKYYIKKGSQITLTWTFRKNTKKTQKYEN